jgi:hypothetical protein
MYAKLLKLLEMGLPKVEELVPVRVVIRTVEILPYAIFRNPKPVTSLFYSSNKGFSYPDWEETEVGRRTCSLIRALFPLCLHEL